MANLRFQVVAEAFKKKPIEIPAPAERPSEFFGKYVFNKQKMFKYLPKKVYDKMLDVIDNYIVPRTGLIFLTPQSRMGRAPFSSSEKILGAWHVKTLWFNMSVMLLMCIVLGIFLYADCPGRFIRKSES